MAVDVTCLGRMLKEEQKTNGIRQEGGLSSSLITRDLLGSSSYSRLGSKELDLDLQVPLGWEKRLDLESGKVYLKRCTSTDEDEDEKQEQKNPRVQDLNYPPAEDSLELKLFPTNNANYQIQSVCTLDKVKSALERANNNKKKNKKKTLEDESGSSSNDRMSLEDSSSSSMLFAGGCPSCLLYVLISKANPKCPRCHATVPSPLFKKPRIDLNCTSSLN